MEVIIRIEVKSRKICKAKRNEEIKINGRTETESVREADRGNGKEKVRINRKAKAD